jgi:hypothetical protein
MLELYALPESQAHLSLENASDFSHCSRIIMLPLSCHYAWLACVQVYVVVDASGTFSEAVRDAAIDRMVAAGAASPPSPAARCLFWSALSLYFWFDTVCLVAGDALSNWVFINEE